MRLLKTIGVIWITLIALRWIAAGPHPLPLSDTLPWRQHDARYGWAAAVILGVTVLGLLRLGLWRGGPSPEATATGDGRKNRIRIAPIATVLIAIILIWLGSRRLDPIGAMSGVPPFSQVNDARGKLVPILSLCAFMIALLAVARIGRRKPSNSPSEPAARAPNHPDKPPQHEMTPTAARPIRKGPSHAKREPIPRRRPQTNRRAPRP